jgi:hypothetical protein
MGNNQNTNDTWINKINAWSTVTVAVATIALVVVTCLYVRHLGRQIEMQQKQFNLTNRAKIICGHVIRGDVNRGVLKLTNKGDLPAEDFKLIWKYMYIENVDNKIIYPTPISKTNILSHSEEEIIKEHVVDPDMDIVTKCEWPEVAKEQERVILFVAYKYKCQGSEEFRRKEYFYYWNEAASIPKWVQENYNLADVHIVKLLKS